MAEETDRGKAELKARLAEARRLVEQLARVLEEDPLRQGTTTPDRDAKDAPKDGPADWRRLMR